jgi:uridine kinase
MESGTRGELLAWLAEVVGSVEIARPTRVAVDGPPAAGKTTLTDELADVLRYARGELSPEGCYYDSFEYDALYRVLLDPLGPDGDRKFQTAVYDKRTDAALSLDLATAPADAVLLFDGVFLLRPELVGSWDLRIFVSVAFDRTLARAQTRDGEEYGTTAVVHRWRSRYIPSQQMYLVAAHPTDHADIIVHNDEPQRPAWEVSA